MEFDKEVLRGYIDTIILSQLVRTPMYGYELAKAIHHKSQGQFELKEGTMYLSLKRLEQKGFIQAYWGDDNSSGGGRRKYYRVLPLGLEHFEGKCKEWQAMKFIMEIMLNGGDEVETN